jgi:hypothetical protein
VASINGNVINDELPQLVAQLYQLNRVKALHVSRTIDSGKQFSWFDQHVADGAVSSGVPSRSHEVIAERRGTTNLRNILKNGTPVGSTANLWFQAGRIAPVAVVWAGTTVLSARGAFPGRRGFTMPLTFRESSTWLFDIFAR